MVTRGRNIAGKLTFFDPAKKYLWSRRETRYHFHDDFDSYATIPGDGSRANGSPWVEDITLTLGTPTVSFTADAPDGVIATALEATSEAMDATIHWDDNRHIDIADNAPVFQCYARLTTLPTLNGIGCLGLADDHNAGGMAGTTYNIGFTVDSTAAVTCRMDDNATVTTAASGITMVVNQWYAFRIDFTTITNVKFFIDGAVVAGSTTFSYAATGADANLQPFIGVSKASGAGLGVLAVDSVDIWQD